MKTNLFLGVIPLLIGPLAALVAILWPLLVGIAAFFTGLFGLKIRTQNAPPSTRTKFVVAAVILTILTTTYGGWWLYKKGVEAGTGANSNGENTNNIVSPPTSPNDSPPVNPSPQQNTVLLLAPPKLAWKIQNATADFGSSPAISGEFVYLAAGQGSALGGTSGFIACVRATSGEEIWRFQTARHIFSSPTVADGVVLVGEGLHHDQQTNLHCLDAKTGELRWKFPVPSHLESSPLVQDGRIYFGAGDAGVYCVSLADGKQLWHRGSWHVDSRAAFANGKIIVGSGYDPIVVACLDAATGKTIWEYSPEIPAWGEPRIVGDRVIIGIGNGDYSRAAPSPAGALLALNLNDGSEAWRVTLPDAAMGAAAIENNRVYFGCRDGYVRAVDLTNGKILWQQKIGVPVLSSPHFANGMILFGAHDGHVRALRASDGAPLWSFNAGLLVSNQPFARSRILSSPAVADGKLFVGLSPGGFVALTDLGKL